MLYYIRQRESIESREIGEAKESRKYDMIWRIHTLVERPEFHVRYIPERCIVCGRVFCRSKTVDDKRDRASESERDAETRR